MSGGRIQIGLFLLVLVLSTTATLAASAEDSKCYWAGPRVDCGFVGVTREGCEAKGCCWQPAEFQGAPYVDLPWCFTPNAGPSEFRAEESDRLEAGAAAALRLSRGTQPELGADLDSLRLDVRELGPSTLRLRIRDAAGQRWAVPSWLYPQTEDAKPQRTDDRGGDPQYRWQLFEDPFSVSVSRPSRCSASPASVFNTSGTRLVFKEQYLELTSWLDPAVLLFGAGERASETLHLARNGMPRPIWAGDRGPTFPENNMYGAHPFVMALAPDGSAWGILLLSSNGMDVVPTDDRITWRVSGGILDVYFFMGPSPLAVMDQYTALVGRPALMPYWSLGWHQSKYGYKSVWEVEQVVSEYAKADIPLETMWSDIDHMDRWMDFTFDPINYPLQEMQRFVGQLHENGQRWVPIVDPGIKVERGYPAYEEGLTEGIFLQDWDGRPYLGSVWPGPCHFPDWLDARARAVFQGWMRAHHERVAFDGIWIDMGEVSNFCPGDQFCELKPGGAPPPESGLRNNFCELQCREPSGLNASMQALLHPPYDVANRLNRTPLGAFTASVLARHLSGDLQYNTHNLFGHASCLAMHEAVRNITGKRAFVLSRASFVGTGAYAAHWTGDNQATWNDLRLSIPGVLNIGLFGMPMAGVDVCGFSGDTTEELCARWISLGAFYPFARDHSGMGTAAQEPYRWPVVADAARKALGMRYRLLPYLYTALHAASETGAPVMRPVWMEFPGDQQTHGLDRQVMLGPDLLVTPVLDEGARSVRGYFPAGARWYSLWDQGQVIDARSGGQHVELQAPLGSIPLHMRGGAVLGMQRAAMTTQQVQRSPLTVVAALPEPLVQQAAAGPAGAVHLSGVVFMDDGESLEASTSPCHFLTMNVSVERSVDGSIRGQLLLDFGRAGSGSGSCRAAAGGHAAGADLGFEWPELEALELLGWHLPAGPATFEVLQRTEPCGGLTVLSSRTIEPGLQVVAQPGGLRVSLASLAHRLKCGLAVRLTFGSAAEMPVAQS